MRQTDRRWTDADMVELAELRAAGLRPEEIAPRINRSVNATSIRCQRFISCPVDGAAQPRWGKRRHGQKLWWTRERVIAGLRDYARRHPGQLTCSSTEYARLKSGHPEWPVAAKVTEYFGSMPGGWEAAGVSRGRYHRGWVAWSEEDDGYLLEHAGEQTLKIIGAQLNRSWAACKRRLYDLGAGRARDVPGYLSAMQTAEEYHSPLSRVHRLIASGELPAFKVKGGHYWRINPIDIKGDLERKLRAPKRRSYKTSPPDVGDYYRRYGLRRTLRDGRMVRVSVERTG